MLDNPPLRLNDIITRGQGPLHLLDNSLRRNTISGQLGPSLPPYYQRLLDISFRSEDLPELLKHLFLKERLDAVDRNLIRRVLLLKFYERIVCGGGKCYVNFLRFHQWKTGSKMDNAADAFYFLLRGRVKVCTSALAYLVYEGNVFGHTEILAEDKIDSLLFKEDTILLSLNLDAFNQHFRTYFEHFFKQKEKYVTGIRGVILERLPRINQLLLLNSLETVMFKAGETLVIKNTYLGKLYFDSSAKLTENSSLYKCIGLKELIQGSKLYEYTIVCLAQTEMQMISYDTFKRLIRYLQNLKATPTAKLISAHETLGLTYFSNYSLYTTRMCNFVKLQKVKMGFNRRKIATEPHYEFEASFVFIKPQMLKTNYKIRAKSISINPDYPGSIFTLPKSKRLMHKHKPLA